ncbi:hypothetical protein F7725_010272 [Dissostichus mawsoni]|uniref:Uncharacterized protein n=1 Tax=Dissostichus mawsoni TaxID=36200 RepID=A0A7J5XN68_DISMA|nr:hypothetical protein F7725_010272 [Dissostichus mawsoni]
MRQDVRKAREEREADGRVEWEALRGEKEGVLRRRGESTSDKMMSLCRNLAVLLLFLIASPLPHSHLFTHATSTTAPATRPRIIFLTGFGSEGDDDDDDDDYEKPTVPTQVVKSVQNTLVHQAPKLCHYDFCLENQEPCDQISAKTGCLCPGVSGGDQPPHSPRIQELVPITRGGDRGKIESGGVLRLLW